MLSPSFYTVDRILGDSHATQRLRARIVQSSRFRYSVLVTGPSGSGKELVARAIHAHSPRAERPLIPVNCAALHGDLFTSQMFGHVKGAFTGAQFASLGCFRAADGGTIFLDEIGELDLNLQSKLLRVLQERQVTPVGGAESIPVDVRVVAATNRNLEQEVREGRFRLDLFYRLNVVSMQVLSLKDRQEDIPVLAQYFLDKASLENGLERLRFSDAAFRLLETYHWPGNVRQLQNMVERAVVFATDTVLGPEHFTDVIENSATAFPTDEADFALDDHDATDNTLPFTGSGNTWPTLDQLERNHIERTLKEADYNQSGAARLLGVDRKLLARKIQKYGIALPIARRG
jgi:transcriptional regulator with GAF, ATPase, and Fis domain